MNPPPKTRFAPSPTGRLHLGNVRTALFNWLLARHTGGSFLLRFEDTDLERSAQAFEEGMEQDLIWLGLQWDEGPGRDPGLGPFRQSQRIDIYAAHFQHLEEQGAVYPCFCTQEELAAARQAQLAAGRPPRYAGTCARLSETEVQSRLAAGRAATLRFRIPEQGTVEFEDMVRGPQRFACADLGDFVIRRSDGMPAFFFTNAVDDALMGITHVLRGEDHLTNTPRQLLLLQALALPQPRYGHTSMLVGADGAPLSKRSGSRSVEELRGDGFLPSAVVNYLARLGHHYEQEGWLDEAGLAQGFAIERLGRAPARFDHEQLCHWQREALRVGDEEALWRWLVASPVGGELLACVPDDRVLQFVRVARENILLPADALAWARRWFGDGEIESSEALAVVTAAGAEFFHRALDCLSVDSDGFSKYTKAVGKAAGVKGKDLFMPLRAALTGEVHGPEMAALWPLLGHERVRRRLQRAARLCEQ